ncbi:PD-(D/E)XK nuclease family protein [uncultured Methanospirillum sp.]|uniref:PD-(D/E)XK nuclease family protein n=1 Tax=uncultured Methanospirillum sp. TaxID=262503 RepID=UPI0029C73B8C|nr:PD-(D/E)XK nuclease family protein [uncultured Methanospirillum sp.]
MLKLSVSALHLCQHCPRLLGYFLEKNGKAWRIGHKGSGKLPGKYFHYISRKVHSDISGRGDQEKRQKLINAFGKPSKTRSSFVLETIKMEYFYPYLLDHGIKFGPDNAIALGAAMKVWSNYLCEMVTPHIDIGEKPDVVIRMVFQDASPMMKTEFITIDGTKVLVRGSTDGILFDITENTPIIVEYKGKMASNPTQELIQTALYSKMFYQNTGLFPGVHVLYLEEEEPLIRYSVDQIKTIIKGVPQLVERAKDVASGKRPILGTLDKNLCKQCFFFEQCEEKFGR